MTPASARAAAEDLAAAAAALCSGWRAGALALPSDLMPGQFAAAQEERYPMDARVTDVVVARERTLHALEVQSAVI